MHIDPTKPKLKPPGTKRLKLKRDILLSTSAFKFNLRRYTVAAVLLTLLASRLLSGARPRPPADLISENRDLARRADTLVKRSIDATMKAGDLQQKLDAANVETDIAKAAAAAAADLAKAAAAAAAVAPRGKAVQVDPIRPTLKAPNTKRLKLKVDELLSNVAFNFNSRRYTEEPPVVVELTTHRRMRMTRRCARWQGLTLVHLSAQPEPFMTQTPTLNTP